MNSFNEFPIHCWSRTMTYNNILPKALTTLKYCHIITLQETKEDIPVHCFIVVSNWIALPQLTYHSITLYRKAWKRQSGHSKRRAAALGIKLLCTVTEQIYRISKSLNSVDCAWLGSWYFLKMSISGESQRKRNWVFFIPLPKGTRTTDKTTQEQKCFFFSIC